MDRLELQYPLNLYPEPETGTQKIDSLNLDIHESFCEKLKQEHQIDVKQALLFYPPSQRDPITFVGTDEINIGRRDPKGRITPELDLSDYQARELGVSRLHAQISWDGEQFIIQDLHSTNHTRLNGKMLIPYHYTPLSDGSTIQVGQLMITVFVINRD